MTLPTVYLPHGAGPCFFMEWQRGPADTWDRTAAYLRGLIDSLPERPKAILIVSGHWEAPAFTVGTGKWPALIYDYFGFPESTYELTFAAPGSPGLARRIRTQLANSGLPAAEDPDHGWDHGVFVPLKLVTPDADIPVVQLSLKDGLVIRPLAGSTPCWETCLAQGGEVMKNDPAGRRHIEGIEPASHGDPHRFHPPQNSVRQARPFGAQQDRRACPQPQAVQLDLTAR